MGRVKKSFYANYKKKYLCEGGGGGGGGGGGEISRLYIVTLLVHPAATHCSVREPHHYYVISEI